MRISGPPGAGGDWAGALGCARDWRGAEGGPGGEAAGTEPPQSPAPLVRAGGAQKIIKKNQKAVGAGADCA